MQWSYQEQKFLGSKRKVLFTQQLIFVSYDTFKYMIGSIIIGVVMMLEGVIGMTQKQFVV
jgi:hypothetical protein